MSRAPARLSPPRNAAINDAIASGGELSTPAILSKKDSAGLISFGRLLSPMKLAETAIHFWRESHVNHHISILQRERPAGSTSQPPVLDGLVYPRADHHRGQQHGARGDHH